MATQQEIADHLDLSKTEVSKWLAEVGIDWKKTSLDVIRVTYIQKLRAVAAGHRSSTGVDLTHERAMTERVDREIKELTLAEKRGQLVNVSQLEPALVQMVVAFRADMLARDDKLKVDLEQRAAVEPDARRMLEQLDRTWHMLDELDAPLDESNIGRFTDLLKKFVKDSQFIIITHNKRTVAAATAIYGVTMEERGVSKTVSMRFNHAHGEAEAVHPVTVADAVRDAVVPLSAAPAASGA